MPWNAKKYSRINWRNRPSTATALGATNLNRMDAFLNEVDNALIEFNANKLNISTANSMLKSLSINTSTGVIVATELSGKTYTWDLNLEKIPVSFSLSSDGVLTMITSDGTEFTANIADLIKEYVFDDSDTIAFLREFKNDAYHVSAVIKVGSITGEYLNPDYRAQILEYRNVAQEAANDSLQYSKDSKRWAVGDSEYPGSENDNAKKYKELAEAARDAAEQAKNEAQATTGIVVMAPGILGVGMPDNITVIVNEDGTITANCFDSDGEIGDED